jgi:hypothetical protein
MFSEGGIEADAAHVSARASSASSLAFSLLLAEVAAFALAAASDKIPAFLFTAVRALLTF